MSGSDSGSVTDPTVSATTVDWGELISAVVAEIERQYGTTPAMSGSDPQSVTTAQPLVTAMEWTDGSTTKSWMDWMMSSSGKSVTDQSLAKTTLDVQSCIDSIMKIVSDLNNQLPGNSGTTQSSLTGSATTPDMSAMISDILNQFG